MFKDRNYVQGRQCKDCPNANFTGDIGGDFCCVLQVLDGRIRNERIGINDTCHFTPKEFEASLKHDDKQKEVYLNEKNQSKILSNRGL